MEIRQLRAFVAIAESGTFTAGALRVHVTQAAMDLDDANYPYSWLPPEDHEEHTRQLSERGPEAFPD